MNSLKIQYVPLEELQRWPRNPKDHDLGTIHQSVERFGFVNPLIVDERTGKLVVGHGRLDVLQQMKASGEKPPDKIRKKGKSWLVPVVRGVEFESDAEAEGYLIADNRLTELGGWLDDTLTQVLSDLAADGAEALEGIGFDLDDVDEMIKKQSDHLGLEGEDDPAEVFRVVIDCATEEEQTELLEKLQEEGLKCRASKR